MRMHYSLSFCTGLGATLGIPAYAAELSVKLNLPQIDTAEYQRPYLAVWIERDDDTFVNSLTLWHRVLDRKGNPLPNGDRYLNTLREWWKQSGATSQLPIDGVSSATRAPGDHELVYTLGKAPLTALPPGKYQLAVEVAREVKGPRPAGAPAGGQWKRPEGAPTEGATPASSEHAEGGEHSAEQRSRGEGGGHGPSKDVEEVLRMPFEWPVKKERTIDAQGKTELGAISLLLKP